MSDLKEKLAAIKAEREQYEASQRERRERAEIEAQVKQEQLELEDAKAIDAAEEQHGTIAERKIAAIRTTLGVVILKRPHHLHYKRFRDKGKFDSESLLGLVKPCIVHPSASAFDDMLEDQPGTLERVADAVVSLAGFRNKEADAK